MITTVLANHACFCGAEHYMFMATPEPPNSVAIKQPVPQYLSLDKP